MYSAENLTILIAELKRHPSGHLWGGAADCLCGWSSSTAHWWMADPRASHAPKPCPSVTLKPATAVSLFLSLPDVCIHPGESPGLLPFQPPILYSLPEDGLPPTSGFRGCAVWQREPWCSRANTCVSVLTTRKTEPHQYAPNSTILITPLTLTFGSEANTFSIIHQILKKVTYVLSIANVLASTWNII